MTNIQVIGDDIFCNQQKIATILPIKDRTLRDDFVEQIEGAMTKEEMEAEIADGVLEKCEKFAIKVSEILVDEMNKL